jgi:hypothetical protein
MQNFMYSDSLLPSWRVSHCWLLPTSFKQSSSRKLRPSMNIRSRDLSHVIYSSRSPFRTFLTMLAEEREAGGTYEEAESTLGTVASANVSLYADADAGVGNFRRGNLVLGSLTCCRASSIIFTRLRCRSSASSRSCSRVLSSSSR